MRRIALIVVGMFVALYLGGFFGFSLLVATGIKGLGLTKILDRFFGWIGLGWLLGAAAGLILMLHNTRPRAEGESAPPSQLLPSGWRLIAIAVPTLFVFAVYGGRFVLADLQGSGGAPTDPGELAASVVWTLLCSIITFVGVRFLVVRR